jgi:hypothetical protein
MPEEARLVEKTEAKTVPVTKAPPKQRATSGVLAVTDSQLESELDRLSLMQAVRDFEIANARVVDLTQRLISANQRIVELQKMNDLSETALVELQSRHAELHGRHAELAGSRAYQLAQKAGALRSLLRR